METTPETTEPEPHPKGIRHYAMLGEIGRGSMGVIHRGQDVDLGREVAMKVLNKELCGREDVVQRFIEEAQIGGQLQHPGVVPVYELGETRDERPYFTMKLVKGRTLAVLLKERGGPGADRRMLDIFLVVCQTMAYAHSRGVIHRDLKPANIMVGAFGEVQIVDWGLAKVLVKGPSKDPSKEQAEDRAEESRPVRKEDPQTTLETVRSDASSTGTGSLVGSVLGTPAYMPPEQANGRVLELDERSDVFALGAILCEILTGMPPYGEPHAETLILASQGELDGAFARLERSGCDPELIRLARRCLSPAMAVRPKDAGELVAALDHYLQTTEDRARSAQIEAAEARVLAQQERRARKLTLMLATSIGGLALLVGGGWVWKQNLERTERTRVEGGLNDIRAEVATLQASGLAEEALGKARSAALLVDGRGPADQLVMQVAVMITQAESEAEADRARGEAQVRDTAFLARLDELGIQTTVDTNKNAALARDFHEAFLDWGLDVTSDLEDSLTRMRESGFAAELVFALDDWASVLRTVQGWQSTTSEELSGLAIDLDFDDFRTRLRQALVRRDKQTLIAIASDRDETSRLSAPTICVLGSALTDLGEQEEALALFERSIGRFPGDLRLRIGATEAARSLRYWDAAMRHVSAAASLRPEMVPLAVIEGTILVENSRFPSGMRALRRALDRDPKNRQALAFMGHATLMLGRFEEAEKYFRAAKDVSPLNLREVMMRGLALLLTGRVDYETYYAEIEAAGGDGLHLSTIWVLVYGPEELRNVDRAHRILERMEIKEPELWGFFYFTKALVAQVEGRHQEVLELCDAWMISGTNLSPTSQVEHATLRARALDGLGRKEESLAMLLQARRLFNELTYDEPEIWENSGTSLWLEEAESLIAE